MKNVVKIIAIVALLGSLATATQAQGYKNAIGARFSTWGALGGTFKHFTNESTALEANINFRSYSYYYTLTYYDISALYEKYAPINDVQGLQYYFGGGPAVSFYSYGNGYLGSESTFRLGAAGVVGLDYKFANTPISISADYMPSFTFVGGSYFSGNRGGFAVRYTF